MCERVEAALRRPVQRLSVVTDHEVGRAAYDDDDTGLRGAVGNAMRASQLHRNQPASTTKLIDPPDYEQYHSRGCQHESDRSEHHTGHCKLTAIGFQFCEKIYDRSTYHTNKYIANISFSSIDNN